MTDEHRSTREELGAYALGALEPEERRRVEGHLEDCDRCRDELARFSSLPGLLGRLSEEEAASGSLSRDVDVLELVVSETSSERLRLRRRLTGWRIATAAAVLAAVVAWSPWETAPEAWEAPVVAEAEDATAADGAARLYAWEWGTTVEMRLAELPRRDHYVIWTVTDDGTRQQAGAWGPTPGGSARVYGASSLRRDAISRVEVTDEAGELMLTFEFDGQAVGSRVTVP